MEFTEVIEKMKNTTLIVVALGALFASAFAQNPSPKPSEAPSAKSEYHNGPSNVNQDRQLKEIGIGKDGGDRGNSGNDKGGTNKGGTDKGGASKSGTDKGANDKGTKK
jgi:hypothetical protein